MTIPPLHSAAIQRALDVEAEAWAREIGLESKIAQAVPAGPWREKIARVIKFGFAEGFLKGVRAEDADRRLAAEWMLHMGANPAEPREWPLARVIWRDDAGWLIEHENDGVPWREYVEASDRAIVSTGDFEAMAELRATCAERMAAHADAHRAALAAAARVHDAIHRDLDAWLRLDRAAPPPAANPAVKPELKVHEGGKA